MKELQVTSINVGSLGRFVGVWYAIIGIIAGAVSGVSGAVGVVTNNPDYSVLADIFVVIGFVFAGLVIFPLFMFVIGWLHGIVLGVVFDIVSKNSGGLKVTVDEKSLKK